MRDFITQKLREPSVLTDSFVGGKTIGDWRSTQDTASRAQDFNIVNLMFELKKEAITGLTFMLEPALELFFDLPYDGEVAAFEVGEIVTGEDSDTEAEIVKLTATVMTMRLKKNGKDTLGYYDNENLIGSVAGDAVSNGGLNFETAEPSDFSFSQETFSNISGGVDTVSLGIHEIDVTGFEDEDKFIFSADMKYPFYRVSVKADGVVTDSVLKLTACLGVV